MAMTEHVRDSTSEQRGPGKQRLALILLLWLYIVVAVAHAYLAPLTIGPDELAHYEYVNFIAEHGRLPLNGDERAEASYKSDQPPLYHLITAIPAALVDPAGPPYLKRVSDHPRRQLIERTRHFWGLYNTEDEYWPYRAEVLRWHLGRWVAILFGAAAVAMTFFIARELFAGSTGEFGRRGAKERRSRGTGEQESRRETRSPTLRPDSGQVSNPQYPEGTMSPIANPHLLALGAAAIVAFIPRFALTGSMLNYETTQTFFAALFLWTLLRIARQGSRGAGSKVAGSTEHGVRNTQYAVHNTPRVSFITSYAFLLGLFAGLAIVTKLSAVILPLEIVIALWLIGRYRGWRWHTWLRAVAVAAVGTVTVVGWWFGFILYHFNTVAQDGWWTGLLRPLIAADASDATTNRLLSVLTGGEAGFTGAIENLDSGPPWEWLAIFFQTFWNVEIEQTLPLGIFGLVLALLLCLLAAYGLVQIWRRSGQGRTTHGQRNSEDRLIGLNTVDNRLLLSLLGVHLALAFVLPLVRYVTTFSLADTAQGRHVLFMAAPAVAVLLVWGFSVISYQLLVVSNWLLPHVTRYSVRNTQYVLFLPALFLLCWTGVQLWSMTWAYHPRLPVRTVPEAKAQAEHQVDRPVNDYMRLIGFKHQLAETGRLLRLDLIWQATAVSPTDYLVEVSLLDAGGHLQSQWLGYPANGRYPMRAWDVGDIVRDTVWLPVAGLTSGDYELTLDLIATSNYPAEQGSELPLTLTTIQVPATLPAPESNFQVWQTGQPTTRPQRFQYRETILITFDQRWSNQERLVRIVGPPSAGAEQLFAPVRDLGHSVLFVVGPDWPTGEYQLQIEFNEQVENDSQIVTRGPILSVINRWQRQFQPPDIEHLVEANFANQVMLLGYDLGVNRAEPGGGIPVTFYWQGLDWMGDDYTIFTKLLATDQTVHGGRDRLPREGYNTLYWAPGEIVVDPFGVPVDADAPDGIYYLNVGLYRRVGEQAVSLPLVQDGQPIDATSVNLGPIKIGDTPPGLTLETANPQERLDQSFGTAPNLTLLGYDLTDETGQSVTDLQSPVSNLYLTLYWQSERPLPLDYTTFVHLRNAEGKLVAQKDQPPLNGAYPTSLWEPGEIIADEIVLSLPDELPDGGYALVIGMYDVQTGRRLGVSSHPNNEVTLTTIEIDRTVASNP